MSWLKARTSPSISAVYSTLWLASPIQLTSDPDAAVYGRLDPDASHPYRQAEAVKGGEPKAPQGSEDPTHMTSSRSGRTHGTDSNPLFFHQPHFGSPEQRFLHRLDGGGVRSRSGLLRERESSLLRELEELVPT